MTQIDELVKRQAEFLREAARYFEKRDTGGEDIAFWSNLQNAENCRKTADALEAQAARVKKLKTELQQARTVRDIFSDNATALRKKLNETTSSLDEQIARIASLEAQLEAFRKALKPFATLRAGRFMTDGCRYDYRIDVAWIRRAKALMLK